MALNFLSGPQKPNIVSPLPQYPAYEDSMISQFKRKNPSAQNIPDDTLHRTYEQYGLKMFNQPSPTPTGNILQQAVNQLFGGAQTQPGQVLGAQAQQPQINPTQPIPSGTDLAMKYLQSQTPNGEDPKKYFKALQDPDFMSKLQQADKIKPGAANLLLLQGFNESTLGNKSSNIFGALPGGEGSGQGAQFSSPSDALNYQLGPNVLGGGGNPNMNIMGDKNPLTLGRVQQLYKSYNPEGSYVNQLLTTLSGK